MISPDTPRWSQDEVVAYESARECLTHLMAIYSGAIHEERSRADFDETRLMGLMESRNRLAKERDRLHVTDGSAIERVRNDCGSLIRAYNAGKFRP